jgi:uncharacterized protein (DUF934 family)
VNKNIKLIAASAIDAWADEQNVIQLQNDTDLTGLTLQGVNRIDLHFPKFTDGRAYSQAYLLRRRLGFAGDIRATGDVLVDQLLQMQRSGFSSAVLRADQNLFHAERQLAHFANFYQGDATHAQPAFAPDEARP